MADLSLPAFLRKELPACGYGVWVACVWLGLASAALVFSPFWAAKLITAYTKIPPSEAMRVWGLSASACLAVLAIMGGAAASMAAGVVSPDRIPSGLRGVAVALISAAVGTALLSPLLWNLLPPRHATSAIAFLFGLQLAVEASATEVWRVIVERFRPLAQMATVVPVSEPLGMPARCVLIAHAVLVYLPCIALCAVTWGHR